MELILFLHYDSFAFCVAISQLLLSTYPTQKPTHNLRGYLTIIILRIITNTQFALLYYCPHLQAAAVEVEVAEDKAAALNS